MRVRVIYFGMLKDSIGRSEDSIELPAGAKLEELMAECKRIAPPVADFQDALAWAVNHEFARASSPLKDGDEIAVLPPVSGGSHATEIQDSRCRLVHDRIDQQAILAAIKDPADGAVSVFDGIVRNQTRGRQTRYLIYEAYEPMALRQMQELAGRAFEDYNVREVRIVHRLGRLEIGETSIFIAVAAAHRAAAMDACRWLIDTLKKTVPIWKKEFFADGAVWADGEPFPPEIRPTK
jgi:molybdopterin converting factor subunit 1